LAFTKHSSRKKRESDLERELLDHLDLEREEQHEAGLSTPEAHFAAIRSFGNTAIVKENVREAWGSMWYERLSQDLSFAVRLFQKSPAFTIVAILTLGIGIAAATVIFGQVNAVYFKTLPVKSPQDLRILGWTSPNRPFAGPQFQQIRPGEESRQIATFSYSAYLSIRAGTTVFSDVACSLGAEVNVAERLGRVPARFVSGNYFRTLGVDANVGRVLTDDDDRPGADTSVAVISQEFWERAFGGDRGVLGEEIRVNGRPLTIVGVMPKGFFGTNPLNPPHVVMPMAVYPVVMARPVVLQDDRDWTACVLVGRIRDGVEDEKARAEAESLVAQTILANPPSQAYELPRLWLTDAGQGMDGLRRSASPLFSF
jgi:hypothetical protein